MSLKVLVNCEFQCFIEVEKQNIDNAQYMNNMLSNIVYDKFIKFTTVMF